MPPFLRSPSPRRVEADTETKLHEEEDEAKDVFPLGEDIRKTSPIPRTPSADQEARKELQGGDVTHEPGLRPPQRARR